MAFMNAQMTFKQEWVMVDGDCGLEAIPGDLIDLGALRAALEVEDDYESAFDLVKDYTECSRAKGIMDISIKSGYGVRSSASGYMDCTSWAVYTNKREAEQAARQEQRECDGLD